MLNIYPLIWLQLWQEILGKVRLIVRRKIAVSFSVFFLFQTGGEGLIGLIPFTSSGKSVILPAKGEDREQEILVFHYCGKIRKFEFSNCL